MRAGLSWRECALPLVKTLDEAVVVWHRGDVPVMVDPKGKLIPQVRPTALVDAILARKISERRGIWLR